MDTKYKDEVFRKYVQFHESKLDTSDRKLCPVTNLQMAASALLCFPKIDPFYRFRLIKFYEIAENSLRSLRASSLHSLQNAFEVLESVGINLFLYPWKKEFKNIKVSLYKYIIFGKQSIVCLNFLEISKESSIVLQNTKALCYLSFFFC